MIRTALVTLKIHRFEAAAAFLLAAGVGGWALLLWIQLVSMNIPFRCIDGWLIDGPMTRPECSESMQRWAAIAGAGTEPFYATMLFVPFVVGVLAGTPIVARELEAGTAQTAWWLHPSRIGWLLRQVTPIAILFLAFIGLLAVTSDLLTGLDTAWGMSAYLRLGLHGPLVVARAGAAFALALMIGAFVGRTLPTFVLAGASLVVLAVAILLAREAWVGSLEATVIGVPSPETGEMVVQPRAVTTGWGWRDADGTITAEEAPGREPVILGVTDQAALGWERYEAVIYVALTITAIAVSTLVVSRRRPI